MYSKQQDNRRVLWACLWLFMISLPTFILSNPVLADQVAGPADWPMYMYNAQHTGYNDFSRLKPPLYFSWWRKVYDTARFLNEVAVANGSVLVTHGDEHAYKYMGLTAVAVCLNSENGRVNWKYDFGFVERLYPPSIGYSLGFVQVGQYAYSYMSGFDLVSGQLRWKTNYIEQFPDRLAPTIWGGYVFAGIGYNGGMECFNALNGQATWQRNTIGYYDWTPAVHQNRIYTFLNGVFTVYNVADGSIDWALNVVPTATSTNYPCSGYLMGVAPVLDTVQNIAYLMWHEYFTAVDLQRRTVKWRVWGNFGCGINPAIYHGQVFAIDSGIFKCLDGLTGAEIWRFQDTAPFEFPPVVANGYVYVSRPDATLAFDLASHAEVWRAQYGGYLAIDASRLYIAGQDGWLVVYENDPTVVKSDDQLPDYFALAQNYPNPFNPSTNIAFSLPKRADVTLVVYDLLGRVVRTLIDENISSGEHEVSWDGTDESGRVVASGVYLYRLESGANVASRKMLLLK